MMQVSDRQLNQVVQIGHLAQECVAERDFARIMTRELMYLLRSCSGVFIEFDPNSRKIDLMSGTSYQVDHSNMKKYLEYYQFQDPALARFKRICSPHRASSVSTDQVIRSEASYQEREFYRDFLAPTGVHSAVIFDVSIHGQQFGLVGMHRTKPMGHYSDVDHKLIQMVIPYLSLALRFRYSRRQQQKRDDVVENLLRARGIKGYLMLDQNLMLQDVVGDFENSGLIAGPTDLGRMVGRRIFNLLSESVRARLIRIRSGRGAIDESFCETSGDSNRSHRIEVVEHADGSRHFVLVALDARHSPVSKSRLKALSLSPRQSQVVKLVVLGMPNARIARSLGIQQKTVENYLTAIYRKTGTSNRTELVSVLSRRFSPHFRH